MWCGYSAKDVGLVDVKFVKLSPEAKPFVYVREGDACMDMYNLEEVTLNPHETKIVPTGIALEIPKGYEGIIRGRSGLASKGIFVHVGTIESTYRGDVGVIMYNTTDKAVTFPKHSRIAQFTVQFSNNIWLVEATALTDTARGVNGYGSSGI